MVSRFSGEWQEVRLGDIVTFLYGKSQHGVASIGGRYPIMGTGGIIGRASRPLCDWECVIIGRKGTIDRPYYMNEPFWPIDTVFYTKPASGQCVKYQYYLFSSINWRAHMETSGRPSLSRKVIENLRVKIPPIDEQRAIADTLTAFDTHLANLSELIAKKQAVRQGAIEDLISGRTRLGGFSGEWNIVALDSVLAVKRGKRVVRSQLSERGRFPVYQNSLSPLGFFDCYNRPQQSTFLIAAGNAGDVGFCDSPFWAADDCFTFAERGEIHQRFLYYVLLHNQPYLYEQSRRTTIPRLSPDIIEKILIPLPPTDEQIAIAHTLSALDNEITALINEHSKISLIKQGAINDLLSGHTRLPNRKD